MPRIRTKGSILPQSILDAATKLFIERGFDGTSMYDIADALGVTRTAVYYYFKNKEAILAALTEGVTRIAGQIAEQLADHKELEPISALRKLVVQHTNLILDHSLQFRVVERNEERLPPKRREGARRSRQTVLNNFTAVIERGVQSGQFRQVDPRIAAFAMLGMCNWTAWWYQPGGRKTRDEISSLIADLAINAVMRPLSESARSSDVSESLRLLREELAFLEQRINKQPA